MKRTFITGVPGTGKSELAARLVAIGVKAFDIDDVPNLCVWRNKSSHGKAEYHAGVGREWLDAHEYVCDTNRLRKLLTEKDTDITVALGMAQNVDELLPLFDMVILLTCSPKTLVHRLNTRTINGLGNLPEERRQILSWKNSFERRMVERGAIPIDTEPPIDIVAEKVLTEIRS